MMEKKVNVLLISYNFPPFIRAASLRTYTWFRDFDEHIQITVLTRKWDESKSYTKETYFHEDEGSKEIVDFDTTKRIIYIPNKHNTFQRLKYSAVIQKLKLQKVFTFIELFSKWSNNSTIEPEYSIYKEAKELIQREKFDVIIATGEPFVAFKYAQLLARKSDAKTILDYRDGWTTNFSHNATGALNRFLINLQRKYEVKYASSASMVTFVSEHLKDQVLNGLKIQTNKVEIIPNGVDLLPYQKINQVNPSKAFTITFVGTLYAEHRLNYFLDAVDALLSKDNSMNIQLKFIGSLIICPPRLKAMFDAFQLKHPDNIQFIDHLKNEEAIQEQMNATLLLKFNVFEQTKDHFGKKLYEYAASGKQVISINSEPHFSNKNGFFEDHPFQFFCNNAQEVQSLIASKYNEWNAGDQLSNGINISEMYPFSTQHYTKLLQQEILSLASNS